MRWLGLLPALAPALASALLVPLLGLWPEAAFSQRLLERGPRVVNTAAVALAAAQDDPNNARVIVKYRSGSDLARVAGPGGRAQHAGRMGSRLSLPLADGRPLGPHTQGLRGRGLSSRQLVARLSAQPDVEWAVVDERRTVTAVSTEPYYAAGQTSITPTVGQWYLHKYDSTIVSAINAEGAWDLSTGSPAITVAVLDTGVRFDHPDLQGKLWPGYDFVSSDSNARDSNPGRDADASDPGDWSADNECKSGQLGSDSSWHGTQVAGLVGANSGNGLGMSSVGRQVMVLPVRVLGKCGGYDSDIQAAMLWAAGLSSDPVANPHPAQVINLSLGSAGSCAASYQTVLAQLTAARVAVVVAAGNTTGLAVNAPANCNDAIAVAGLRHAGTKVGYSSLGPQVAVAAPAGNCVNETGECLYPLLTTDNSGTTSPGANIYSDSYRPSLGTSFASPLVAGTVGLMLSADPSLTPSRIKAILQATARAFPSTGAQTEGAVACHAPNGAQQIECYCTTSTCGAGMLDAGAAVASVVATALPAVTISASNLSPTVGATITLDGSGASAPAGRSLVRYRWVVTSGSSNAQLSGVTDSASARSVSLVTSAVGAVVVSLTVTDSSGASQTASVTVNVAAVAPAQPAAGSNTGGGAMGGGWLLGLAAAVLALRRSRRA